MTDQTQQFNKSNIYDKKKFWTYDEFVDGGYADFFDRYSLVYSSLCRHVNYQTKKCWPSYKRIMKESGIKNRSTIAQIIRAFEYLGLVVTEHSKGRVSNMYYLPDPSRWKSLNGLTLETVITVSSPNTKRSQKYTSNSRSSETGSIQREGTKGRESFSHKKINEGRLGLGDKMRIKPY